MIIKLKGSPSIAIDANGLMTKSTTWMCYNTGGSNIFDWLAFQDLVQTWAGSVGDAYRNPLQDESGREASTYIEDATFKVTDIAIVTPDGRTHCEVTYTAQQNISVMRQIGNVSASITSNNERTKTISYQIDVASNDPALIDTLLIASGTAVVWAGSNYLMESSNYNADGKTRYTVSYTAKDMSKVMINKPSISTDGFGGKTLDVSWRMSNAEYAIATLPTIGSNAQSWVGDIANNDKYIVTSIDEQPDGALGYVINIKATYGETRLLSHDKGAEWSIADGKSTLSFNKKYQSDEASIPTFFAMIGTTIDGLLVKNINVTPRSVGVYDVVLSADNSNAGSTQTSNTDENLADQFSVTMSEAKLYLTADMCGWAPRLGGLGYYMQNKPPIDTYAKWLDLNFLANENSVDYSEAAVITAIKSTGKTLGKMTIKGVRGTDGAIIPKEKWSDVTAGKVAEILVEIYYYAQPKFDDFVPWTSAQMPVFQQASYITSYPKFTDPISGKQMDKARPQSDIGMPVRYMDCNVTFNYKGNIKNVIKLDFEPFYSDAVDYIQNANVYSFYKYAGITFSSLKNDKGEDWTQVNCTIHALLLGEGVWNLLYKPSTEVV